jgi:hypothetical protein
VFPASIRTDRRVFAAKSCEFAAGDMFVGVYRKTVTSSEFSGKPVAFTFAPEHSVVETSEQGGGVFARWVPAGPNVLVQTLGGAGAVCALDVVAKYELTWSPDCSSVAIDVVRDECDARAARYAGMSLRKQLPVTSATCALVPGTQVRSTRRGVGCVDVSIDVVLVLM